jgi:hypothetical protein
MTFPIPPERVTVAIEGWNASDLDSMALFERSMGTLAKQTYPINACEILILVDESVGTHGPEGYRSYFPEARLVTVPSSTYFKTKNAAIDQATRDVLVFADSDVAYQADWLEQMLSALAAYDGVIAGNTQFDQGFLSRSLSITEWAATRLDSGPTDWFYGNNLAARRVLLQKYGFREDLGQSGGGSVDIVRDRMLADGVSIWFNADARGWHHVAPFWSKYLRLGAYQIHTRRMAPGMRWSWLARVPVLAPFLVIGGGLLKAWRRAWRLRSTLPLHGWSLPAYLVSITFVKSVEWVGAVWYAYFPGWVRSRHDWFEVPVSPPLGISNSGSSARS